MGAFKSFVGDVRRFLRFEPRTEVGVRMEGYAQMAVTLRDVGRGGFAIVAPMPFSPGERYRFTFDLPSGKSVMLSAMAVHRYPLKGEQEIRLYVTGWRFLLENTAEDIDRLMNEVAVPASTENAPT